ncbi:MAG: PEGA domain-containing protein, partial [Minicystis sp.]
MDATIAEELFKRGLVLLEAGDPERALEHFLRSRQAYPSSSNTADAAICLDRLGRYDEALEMYEELLVRFAADLDAEDQANIRPAMAALRQKVGSVLVSANVEGMVMIEARERGRLPLLGPLRVNPGSYLLRVIKDGYATYEVRVVVAAGATVRVDAKLEALAAAGALRVEDPDNEGSEVFVDAVRIGRAPWEGTLGPGRHLVWTRKSDRGSAPVAVVVLQGQTALLRARSGPLGPPVRVDIDPPAAELSLDGVSLGRGSWEGRLPLGTHRLSAIESGYRPGEASLDLREGVTAPVRVKLGLTVDPSHPRWPRPSIGHLSLGAFGGYAFGGSLGSRAEQDCPHHCSGKDPSVSGLLAGLRGAYNFNFGLSLELSGGYQSLSTSLSRSRMDTYGPGDRYRITY